jgi:uncharacterized lipoprotein
MRLIVKNLLLIVFLVSCSSTAEETRYRDTESLERPPIVVTSPSKEQRVVDDSAISKKKDHAGLGEDVVYRNLANQLTIKQPFRDAWYTLARALKQSGVKVTDHERDKGLLYVTQNQDTEDKTGFLAKVTAFLSDDPTIYLLTVKEDGGETKVTATIANATEQSSAAQDGTPHPFDEGAEDLLQLLFKTLRDRLEEE